MRLQTYTTSNFSLLPRIDFMRGNEDYNSSIWLYVPWFDGKGHRIILWLS